MNIKKYFQFVLGEKNIEARMLLITQKNLTFGGFYGS
jgi:hypothetical protein